MVSGSDLVAQQKRRLPHDLTASAADFFDDSSTEGFVDDVGSCDFSSDSVPAATFLHNQARNVNRCSKASTILGFNAVLNWRAHFVCVDKTFLTLFRVSKTYGLNLLLPLVQQLTFLPRREPDVHLGVALRSSSRRFLRARDFFLLFSTTEVIERLCDNTNKYAWDAYF